MSSPTYESGRPQISQKQLSSLFPALLPRPGWCPRALVCCSSWNPLWFEGLSLSLLRGFLPFTGSQAEPCPPRCLASALQSLGLKPVDYSGSWEGWHIEVHPVLSLSFLRREMNEERGSDYVSGWWSQNSLTDLLRPDVNPYCSWPCLCGTAAPTEATVSGSLLSTTFRHGDIN